MQKCTDTVRPTETWPAARTFRATCLSSSRSKIAHLADAAGSHRHSQTRASTGQAGWLSDFEKTNPRRSRSSVYPKSQASTDAVPAEEPTDPTMAAIARGAGELRRPVFKQLQMNYVH